MNILPLVFAGIAVVVFLLVVLVVQASMARIILQDLRSNNVLHQSSTGGDGGGPGPIIKSYGLIVDAATSAMLTRKYGLPPAQSGYAICTAARADAMADATAYYSMQPVTYPTTLWLPIAPSSNSTRFQKDVAAGKVTTVMIANVSAKIWLASWPAGSSGGGGSQINNDNLFVIAPCASAQALDPNNYTTVVVVDPVLTPSESSWGTLVGSLSDASGDGQIPVHVWAF